MLGIFQPRENWLHGNKMDVALDMSHHSEIDIIEITQPSLVRNVLSNSARRPARKE